MKITSDYDTHTKDELLAEAQSRGIDGVNSSSLKADIVAALALDDETPDQPPAPLPPLKPSNLPQIAKVAIPDAGADASVAPKDDEYNDGIFTNRASGEKYALCIRDAADTYGNTHFLKNSAHYWAGTETQFNGEFSQK